MANESMKILNAAKRNRMRPFKQAGFLLLVVASALAAAQQQDAQQQPSGLDEYKIQLIPPRSGLPSATTNIDSTEASMDTAPADPAHLSPVVPAGRQAIGLVLEGGGAMGLAHIGVLQWFEEHHIPVDRISGTSMGALVGGLYASGRSVKDLHDIATGDALNGMFTLEAPYTDVSYRRRQDRRELPQAIQFGLRGGLSLRNSLLTDRTLDKFLRNEFSAYNSHAIDYDRLPIPFRCVATDLTDLRPLIFHGGPLPDAVRASISIPGIFPPVDYHKHYLVDGAIMDNLPTDIVKRDLHADIIIAVDLPDTAFADGDIGSIVGVFARAFNAGTARNVRVNKQLADVLVSPATDKFTTTDYDKAQQLIDTGYQAAELRHEQLLRYALNEADWNAYLAARNSRIRHKPGLLQALRIEGGSEGVQQRAAIDMDPLKKQPIDANQISTALNRVQGNGSYVASFQTFKPGPNSVQAPGPDTGVAVRLDRVRNGPPFLLFGADVSAMNSNVTRGTFDFRYVHQNLGGFGSELRGDLRLGFLTQASAEYYRLFPHSGLFIQPHGGILRQPVYLWSNQQRSSEWLQQQAGGGLDIGRTFNRNMQVALGWQEQIVRWHLTLGNPPEQSISGTSQTAAAHFVYDSTESGTISPRGLRFDLTAGALYHTFASENAPMVQLRTARTVTFHDKNVFGFTADADTYFRRNVADPLRFTLGGPLRLSASSIDEYRGTDDFLIRAGYLRRIAALPTGLGEGLYFTLAYEGGEIWSPERPAYLRQDGVTGVVAATPLGVITFGGSIGDAGRRKVFFSLGRLF